MKLYICLLTMICKTTFYFMLWVYIYIYLYRRIKPKINDTFKLYYIRTLYLRQYNLDFNFRFPIGGQVYAII